ncbi:MAG: DNA repair protein RecO [Acholeplasmataceae bacterium]|nr:DNA repair protein RecO [Acholeplasmataceae bacterium]
MNKVAYQDEIIILRVKDWQTADKYAVCFSREHGKVSFIAYGARYGKSNGGRLIQPFAQLSARLIGGRRFDTLQQCELSVLPQTMDILALAYSAVIAEAVENLTEEYSPQEEIFILLQQALVLLGRHNKRLVVVSALCKLLSFCGFDPALENCTTCHEKIEGDAYFSTVQGGVVCDNCSTGAELPFAVGTRELMLKLQRLDFANPEKFVVRGADLMQLEQTLYKFLVYQTDKPLVSLQFLAQISV